MDILEKIVAQKRKEIEHRKQFVPTSILEKYIYFEQPTQSLANAINNSENGGIIAEFKRKSPSKGSINDSVSIKEVTSGYANAGAAGVSILTDHDFFGGSLSDIFSNKSFIKCPILRKEFIIDTYQIVEAKAVGADAILLIAECLSKKELLELATFANSLGLEVLMELHSEIQLDKINDAVQIVGVNNRDLKKFVTTLDISYQLVHQIPASKIKISESGIHHVEDVINLQKAGYRGFLIGELFMKNENPPNALFDFIHKINI